MTAIDFPPDGKQRSYFVLFHFREGSNGPEGQQSDLDVRATNAQRAIDKVINENLDGVTKRDIVIDEVNYNEPEWAAMIEALEQE
jgi:hypothetical protein